MGAPATPSTRRFPLPPPASPRTYVLDFYFSEARLAIEVDGHSHGMGDRPRRDQRRDDWLRSKGVKVMRYVASDVLDDPDGVAASIVDAARAPGWGA